MSFCDVCELLQLTTATTPFSYSFLPSSSFHQCCLKESENASRRPEQILRQNYFLPHVICTEQYNVLWPLPYISITWFPDSLFFLSYMEWKRNESVYIVACRRFLIVLGDFFLASFGILSNFLRTEQTLSNFCLPGQPFSNFWPFNSSALCKQPLRFLEIFVSHTRSQKLRCFTLLFSWDHYNAFYRLDFRRSLSSPLIVPPREGVQHRLVIEPTPFTE